jgi:hypothetical protein
MPGSSTITFVAVGEDLLPLLRSMVDRIEHDLAFIPGARPPGT